MRAWSCGLRRAAGCAPSPSTTRPPTGRGRTPTSSCARAASSCARELQASGLPRSSFASRWSCPLRAGPARRGVDRCLRRRGPRPGLQLRFDPRGRASPRGRRAAGVEHAAATVSATIVQKHSPRLGRPQGHRRASSGGMVAPSWGVVRSCARQSPLPGEANQRFWHAGADLAGTRTGDATAWGCGPRFRRLVLQDSSPSTAETPGSWPCGCWPPWRSSQPQRQPALLRALRHSSLLEPDAEIRDDLPVEAAAGVRLGGWRYLRPSSRGSIAASRETPRSR